MCKKEIKRKKSKEIEHTHSLLGLRQLPLIAAKQENKIPIDMYKT